MLNGIIDEAMNKLLDDYMDRNGVKTGGATAAQVFKWDNIVQEMANLMEEITERSKQTVEKIELPMPYVLTMLDALQAIKKHKLYGLMGCEEEVEWQINTVIEEFLDPIVNSENVDDIEIDLYE